MTIKTCIGLILAYILIGCTSAKPLVDQTFTQESLTQQLDTKHCITVVKNDGEKYRLLKVEVIGDDFLFCHNNKYKHLQINYSSIKSISIEYPDQGKSILLFASIVVGILAVGAISIASTGLF